ncbi:penicillin-binding protein 1A [Altericroceibacterium xinjiangense]|uniref:penicillin-binding protein 1A n=1 Tax=Altericroceibacterium xinjiangense TaxID=762261 RepID=UPI000F7DC4F0|nr:transglycosylase domain-containing protein [Altericroceibacterium xinjiangense]
MADTPASAGGYFRYRLRRDSGNAMTWLRDSWSRRFWFRWGAILFGIGLAALLIGWTVLARTLPDAKTLLVYEPPLPTNVRGVEGEIVHSFARDRRVQLQYQDFPHPVINAFLAAEDRTFWTHGGIDFTGLFGAVVDYASKIGSGERAKGGSTITQQVAKNILLGNEYSVSRKLKEMVLASRIEGVLGKEDILTLYLNQIPLGRRSFGVQAASRAYFDKDIDDLELHEAAFLAILPKAPEQYGRVKYREQALVRRNWVLDQMARNDWASDAEVAAAKAQPLGLVEQRPDLESADAGYFLEEVRRDLIDRYGEQAEDGPHSVYAGGLWVRTSLDTEMQDAARDSLRAALLDFHGNKGWAGAIATINPDNGKLTSQLASANIGINYKNWRVGVVTERSGDSAQIGFSDGTEAPLTNLPEAIKVGDVTAAAPDGDSWAIRAVPEVSGGFLVMDPNTGRIYAMQGGFDSRLGSFNRATQAQRQPGSTIKPFVYATALDWGMTPSTMVPDTTYCVYQGVGLGQKCFRNFGGQGGGSHTMRWGLEQSRNLMTMHIAMGAGMDKVVRTIERVGIGDYEPYPSIALGAGDTTVVNMVGAYGALFNNGLQHRPTTIDFVQDRRGKVIWRADKRECAQCNMAEWNGQPMPRLPEQGRQVLDPRTAYQVVHMMEGVVQRGTAVRLRDLGLPLAGKTGTTNGPTNVWFVGGTPDIVGGVYIGYDQPRNLGGWAQGGRIAAPVFKQFVEATRDKWSNKPFLAPAGVRMVRVDRRSGRRVFDRDPTRDPLAPVIWEAFKPDTEPKRTVRPNETSGLRELILTALRRQEEGPREVQRQQQRSAATQRSEPTDFIQEQGGIY